MEPINVRMAAYLAERLCMCHLYAGGEKCVWCQEGRPIPLALRAAKGEGS